MGGGPVTDAAVWAAARKRGRPDLAVIGLRTNSSLQDRIVADSSCCLPRAALRVGSLVLGSRIYCLCMGPQSQQSQLAAAAAQQKALTARVYEGQRDREDHEVLQSQVGVLSRRRWTWIWC